MFPSHHVLPQNFADHPVVRFLADRFNIDAISNRMALPPSQWIAANLNSSPHTGGHLGTYYDGFRCYLNQVGRSSRFDATIGGDTRAREELISDVNGFVAAAKYALANGHLFANTPTGMTPESANEQNKKWFESWRQYAADNRTQIDQMRTTVDQLSSSGQAGAALHWPLLSPTSDLTMQERNAIIERYGKDFPFSLQSTAVGPVPVVPGLIPSLVDTRLRGFSPAPAGLNEKEGLARSDPRLSSGIPAFPAPSGDEQRLGQLPPSKAAPPELQVLQFHSETGQPLSFSDGSPVLGPNPYAMPLDPNAGPAVLRGMAVFGAAATAPIWVPLLPALLSTAVVGLAAAKAARAEPTSKGGDRASVAETSPLHPFDLTHDASNIDAQLFGARSASEQAPNGSFGQGPMQAGTFADRFQTWADTRASAVPDQSGQDVADPPAAVATGPQEARRLTRVNTSNAGSVFDSGSAPVPYLPSPEFNDRFGNWHIPTGASGPQRPSMPIGVFKDEPSYVIPPPIFGAEDAGAPRSDTEEWFSRWIRPFLRPE